MALYYHLCHGFDIVFVLHEKNNDYEFTLTEFVHSFVFNSAYITSDV